MLEVNKEGKTLHITVDFKVRASFRFKFRSKDLKKLLSVISNLVWIHWDSIQELIGFIF